ncbi:hypothetical protein BJV78DRAFT_1158337 [Lactifluus subvellereus]|nr:hypothetical protein BJV78DRAFT_1158337 [Lactifluus subvellereus]
MLDFNTKVYEWLESGENSESNSQPSTSGCLQTNRLYRVHGISEDDEREIFRRVQRGMVPNYAEEMKAEGPTPRQTLVYEFVAEFGTPLRSLGFNHRRDPAFRWRTAWLKDTAPLDLTWKKRVQHTYKLLIDTLKAYPDRFKVSRGPATIALIELVMMVLLVFELQNKLSASRVADALLALRMSACNGTNDLM